MILLIAFISLINSLILIRFRSKSSYSNIYLALFLLTISGFATMTESIFNDSDHLFFYYFFPYQIFFNFLTWPLLYFYVQSVVDSTFRLKRIHVIHFLPALLFTINALPLAFLNISEKEALLTNAFNSVTYYYQIPTYFFPFEYHVLFRQLGFILYLLISFIAIVRHSFDFKLMEVKITSSQITWIYLVLFILFFYCIVGVLTNMTIFSYPSNKTPINFNLSLLFGRYVFVIINLLLFFFPTILLQRLLEPRIAVKIPKANKFKNIYAKYDLDKLDTLLNDYLDTKPYLEPSFSLSLMSASLAIPQHQITYYLNMRFDQNFNEFKNFKRIMYAKALLDSGNFTNFTLEAISEKCGFLSRTNFNEAFVKYLKQTPSQYLSAIK